jgi:FAD/FMN-containing dehydrogenase/Fe-S oxidoreductase
MPPLASFASEMRRIVEGDVRFDAGSLAAYSTDASNYRRVPVGVVCPRHPDDVIRAVALARENAVPIVARGGGTSLAGQACNAALVMDFSRYMTAVKAIDAEGRSATVESGVVQSRLNAQVGQFGLFFPPDPATKDRCTLGGMIGNNSCGAHSAAYGKTVDNILALDVLLYDGTRLQLGSGSAAPGSRTKIQSALDSGGRTAEIYSRSQRLAAQYAELIRGRFPRIPRRVSGYNLDELLPENGFNLARALVGSEGTLALVLGATVKLVPRPKELVLVVLGFADIFQAADNVPWLLEHHPEALEAFDHNLVEFGQAKRLPSLRLLPAGGAYLIVELGGADLDQARERGEALLARARMTKDVVGTTMFTDAQERAAVWGLRESGLGAGAPRNGFPRVWPGAEDCAVAPAKLGGYLRSFDQLLQRRGLSVAMYYGHFGQGCIHCRINFDLISAAGIENFRGTMLEIGDLISEHGGSISGEHGDGVARSELLPRMFGPELMAAFKEFKTIFDPEGRMNPGVIVDALPMDSHLRLGAAYNPKQIETHFDFSAEGGLGGAVSRCIGIGKCRKLESGVMCPSYMVTQDELLSTRGRAHMLFEALNGDLLPGGFSDEALHDSLQLCLSCKSCKSECPATVDMALHKAEFLSHYHRNHRRRLRDQLFAQVYRWAPLAARFPGLSNWVSNSALGEIAKTLLAVDTRRALPQLARRSFRQWFASRTEPRRQGREVVLFPDTFNNFFEPDVAIAAVGVLERAGFQVAIPPKYVCCGRPLYDQGMLDEAKLQLAEVMQVLRPWLERGTPIVGLEPGCILTFRDELPRLYPNHPLAQALTRQSFMFEEFLAAEAPGFTPPARSATALLQAHCHHRAIVGMETEIELLRRIEGLKLEVLDSGCCGLAGAFGYAKENYEMSQALAERVLLPALRNSSPDTLVVADGFSCRSQIRHFCHGTRVRHLAQMLNDAE